MGDDRLLLTLKTPGRTARAICSSRRRSSSRSSPPWPAPADQP